MAQEDSFEKEIERGLDEIAGQVGINPELTNEIREMQTELINLNTKLVFAVATCECEDREECDLYQNSKEIAKILKKLQDTITVVPSDKREVKAKKRRK